MQNKNMNKVMGGQGRESAPKIIITHFRFTVEAWKHLTSLSENSFESCRWFVIKGEIKAINLLHMTIGLQMAHPLHTHTHTATVAHNHYHTHTHTQNQTLWWVCKFVHVHRKLQAIDDCSAAIITSITAIRNHIQPESPGLVEFCQPSQTSSSSGLKKSLQN